MQINKSYNFYLNVFHFGIYKVISFNLRARKNINVYNFFKIDENLQNNMPDGLLEEAQKLLWQLICYSGNKKVRMIFIS